MDPATRPDSTGESMDEHDLLAEALAASEMALRATARLANPALERLEHAAISGQHVPRSTVTLGRRLAQDLAEAEARAKRLRAETAADRRLIVARGVRAYAASRHVPRGTAAAAVSAGAIPLTADGAIDVARADREWLPSWRPLAHANPYTPPPDPEVEAQADAALRRDWIAAGLSDTELDAAAGRSGGDAADVGLPPSADFCRR